MSNQPTPASNQPPLAPQPPAKTQAQPQPQQQPQENVTEKLREAQRALLKYDKESVEQTQEKYHAYLRIVNEAQKDPEIKNDQGKTAAQLKEEWEAACKERVAGRDALVQAINVIINPALGEPDKERDERLKAIQQQSEKACLERTNPKLGKYRKPELEKAIDQMGGDATKPFKESAKF